MNSFEFFSELLDRVEEIQSALNKIRDTIKAKIKEAKK